SSKEAMPSAEIRQFARTVANPLPRAASDCLFGQEDAMKMHVAGASLVVMVTTLCGAICAQTKSDQAPSGTVVDKQHAGSNEVQPAPEKIRITPNVVRAAQEKLGEDGYKPGTPDGKMGPMTRAAIRKYQEHEGLKTTATLDESTLSHLGVGGGKIAATAPGDIGRTFLPTAFVSGTQLTALIHAALLMKPITAKVSVQIYYFADDIPTSVSNSVSFAVVSSANE